MVHAELLKISPVLPVTAVVDLSFAFGKSAIHEAVEKAGPDLALCDLTRERRLLANFMRHIVATPELAAIGFGEVQQALNHRAIRQILVATDTLLADGTSALQWLEAQGLEVTRIESTCPEALQFRQGLAGLAAYLHFSIQEHDLEDPED